MKVQIAFDLSANGVGDWFTLDDSTKGKLDNTTYRLGGDVLVDVTADVRSVSVNRGRSKQLQKFTAGQANLVLSNVARKYDPTNTASPYYGSIVPRKQVVIEHLGQTLYSGNVEDWNFSYDLGGNNTAEPSCIDGFAFLAQANATPGTATPQLVGARINTYLTDAGWPLAQRDIATGVSTLGADVIAENTNTLNYLQAAELSDAGAMFIGKDGAFVFRSRSDLQKFSSNVSFGTGGIGFVDIAVTYGTEELFNTVNVTYTGGTVVASSASSIAAYGETDLTIDTLLASASDAAYVANWFLSKYATPTYRVNSLTVALHGLSTTDAQAVLGLELGDMVHVTWTPGGVGAALSRYVTVDGITHDADPSQHFVTFTLSDSFQAFQLDSAVFGQLNDDPLGF